ncbi:MAG: S49 family peptidase [Phycisphaerales bacterium]
MRQSKGWSMVLGALVVAGAWASPVCAWAAEKARVAVVEIKGGLAERTTFISPIGKGETTLRDATSAIVGLGARDDVRGILVRLREQQLDLSQVLELGQAIRSAREAGKDVTLFSYGYDTPELLLGSYCDDVVAQAGGGVSLPGVATSELYLADALAWMGVKADFVQVGAYKGAAEQMVNSTPSKEWSENIDQLLDSLYGVVRERIKKGRKLDDAGLDKAMNEVWMGSAEDARRVGLIDATLDLPALTERLEKRLGGDVEWEGNVLEESKGAEIDAANPFAALRALMEKPSYEPTRPTIAVLHIDGAIVDGNSTSPGIMGGESSVGSLTIRRALSAIEKSDLIKGMVVRIDSPGGSAIASEVMWLGIRRVAEKKPVWVSVGGMAASGGYYVAVAGERIYVNPGSIVGSIGVVGGKLAVGGLLETLKVNVVERTRGPRAGMGGLAAWNDEQRGYIRRKMTDTYDLFVTRVKAGRPGIDVSKTAEGRLFAGQKSIEMKMADRIGGLDDALRDLAGELGLSRDGYDVMSYPAPLTLAEMIEQLLGQSGVSAAAPAGAGAGHAGGVLMSEVDAIGREVLGASGWRSARASLRGLLELRKEPVLLLDPRALIVR